MHRFHLPPESCRGESLRLEGREAHHALQVLRLKRGERVTVLDGAGNEFLCEVREATKQFVALDIKEKKSSTPPACVITLLVAVPKGKIIEGIIQKAVELGAGRIVPLLTDRVVTQLDDDGAESKREKWQQVAIEAIKQCGAAWLPKVETPQGIAEFLAHGEKIELALIGSLQTERRHPREWIEEFQKRHDRLPQSAAVWIGPEGDFTLEEIRQIEDAGAKPVTLGALTLRVETAAIYCLSFLNYELNPGVK
ncbi:MAG TPA: RsmE family RNA methyltransferase [Candidatus Acidoferrales bacterium]|jgi:16S rRNA (uracil1498-N3)-methyltransferase|nr:RsmE family RNA methyltransferase [Candidatus Acidoferrales bacterium]